MVYDKYGSDYVANRRAVRMICGCGVDDWYSRAKASDVSVRVSVAIEKRF